MTSRLLAALVLCGTCLVGAPLPESPTVQIGTDQLTVSGITPGGQAVIMCVAHDQPRFYIRMLRRDTWLSDDDGDGIVMWKLDNKVSPHSVFAVVDLASGAFAVKAHPDGPDSPIPFPDASALAASTPARELRSAGIYTALLLVRPGNGAWLRTCADGDAGDAAVDTPGTLVVRPSSLTPLGTSPAAPETVAAGDVVIGINMESLEYFAARLGGKQ